MRAYSTSFSLASMLFSPRVRSDITHLYAVVRIADEIVDGAAEGNIEQQLSAYEHSILHAPQQPFHPDPIIHAYADTARRCQFPAEYLRAFFTSMRSDLTHTSYTQQEYEHYIYGSAEVIGLLCLRIFLAEQPGEHPHRTELEAGARRLGAAFQKINFLRDIREDIYERGRHYFPDTNTTQGGSMLSEASKAKIIAEIQADLAAAQPMIALLPYSSRFGVQASADLFSELAQLLADTTVAQLRTTRVRLGSVRKVLIIARSVVGTAMRRGSRQA
ncbi:phytoene/squalene synthase family protein [Corynebacterium sp. sy039]|uniref:phytoene/squalene synthase family protein n=1 Tax=Corynebacterium sp. sy039 TaxID=2599641 RepID=UPI0011B49B9B|nr:phytoene/squalene synthase family protein [Corynebacterium sp. sy039]QDZ43466.1 phytoene/squalene synthase family protein [Corynebacterium sp. sy039]